MNGLFSPAALASHVLCVTGFVKRITRISSFSAWRNGGKENRDFGCARVMLGRLAIKFGTH